MLVMMCVSYGLASDYFTASTGVKHDKIVSPILFSIYIDDLLLGYHCPMLVAFLD
jgi:hypothetical protein